MKNSQFLVTKKATRPAGGNGNCFYCNKSIGENHLSDCVLVRKKVKIKATVEYEITVPSSWGKNDVEFHRNEGSWCSDNFLDELEQVAKENSCLCSVVVFEHIADVSENFLEE